MNYAVHLAAARRGGIDAGPTGGWVGDGARGADASTGVFGGQTARQCLGEMEARGGSHTLSRSPIDEDKAPFRRLVFMLMWRVSYTFKSVLTV